MTFIFYNVIELTGVFISSLFDYLFGFGKSQFYMGNIY